MGRINRLIPTTILTANSVIAMDAESGGATNKVTIQTLASGLRSFGNYATQTDLNRKQDVLTFDDSPEEDSDNPVTSGGIYNAIGSAMSNVYTKAETDNAIAQSTASGSNANGTYVKFVDGTMICYNIISQFTFKANSTRTETHDFPAAFVTAPVVTLNINTTIPDKLSLSCYGVNTTQYVLNAVSTFSADQGPTVWVMAIGRWK